ncbi:hypothetical protein ISS30_05525 [bacterium]|nr:hypothetical protein [bacterium]
MLAHGKIESALQVYLAESRPGGEGEAFAEFLAKKGIDVIFAADIAFLSIISRTDCLLIGADSVTGDRFINKTGTGAVCRAAAEASVPVYCICGKSKLIPPALAGALKIMDYPVKPVTHPVKTNIKTVNYLFEWVDNSLVTKFITEEGVYTPQEISDWY